VVCPAPTPAPVVITPTCAPVAAPGTPGNNLSSTNSNKLFYEDDGKYYDAGGN
jgi:hypothetical protein